MRRTFARIHRGLAWLFLAGLLLQFYLAGGGLFGAGTMARHRELGWNLWLATGLLALVALVGRLGRRAIGLSALLLALTTLQVMLPSLRGSLPWVAALHPVNALALLGVTSAIARGRSVATTPSPARLTTEPTAERA